MVKTTVLSRLGQEALLVFVTKICRYGVSWDPGWFVHILFEVGLRGMDKEPGARPAEVWAAALGEGGGFLEEEVPLSWP